MENNIKEVRNKANCSQMQIALKARISRPYLSDIENGKKTPSISTAFRIARALNCDINDLFLDIEGNHSEQKMDMG